MNRELVAFLKQNGAYDAFVKNSNDKVCNGASVKYLCPNPANTLIARAFVWDRTPEGFNFWCELSIKWLCICNEQKEE